MRRLRLFPQQTLRAFTLVELLVVMAVIALLLSLATPRYFGSIERSKEIVLRQNLAQTRDALDKHFGDRGRYPDSLQALVDDKYLRSLPVDPVTGRNDTWVMLRSEDPDKSGIADIRSGAKGNARDGTAYEDW